MIFVADNSCIGVNTYLQAGYVLLLQEASVNLFIYE